jgi:ATP-binding cassette, subfamily B, bacterial
VPPASPDPDGPCSPLESFVAVPTGPPPAASVAADRSLSWWRRVLPLLAVRRAAFLSSLGAALVALVLGVALPRVTMGAIDRALTERSSPLLPFLLVLGGIGLVRAVLTTVYRTSLYRIAYDLEYDLRTMLFGHLTRLPFSFYDRVQAGQLISRANSDIRSVQMFLTFAPLLALTFVSFLVALVLMIAIDPVLTLVAVATLPLVYVAGTRLRNAVFPLSWIVQGRLADVTTIVDENVAGVRVVRSFAAEEREVTRLARAAQRLRWANVATADTRARWGPLMENLPRFGLAGVLLYGGHLVIEERLTIGALVAFNAYVVMLQLPFRMLGFLLMLGQRAAASAHRIYEVLDEAPAIVDAPDAVELASPSGRIELREVRFAYAGGPTVLDGCCLTVPAGEIVAVVGRTGSGKSTLARLLPRFYDVDDGQVLIDGRDVRGLTLASVRRAVGVVLDEPFLFSASIAENIAYARPGASRAEVEAAAQVAAADAFIRALPDGYDSVIGERGYDLSGGQRQRIALARTVLADPAVLVLDDATSAIDVAVEEQIHEGLRRVRRQRTTVLIAHRLSTIALADRVVVLEGGAVVAEGTHPDLLATDPRYAELLARLEHDEGSVDGSVDGSVEASVEGRLT